MGAKKALLVGCNYPGTKAELKGCINDVKRMQRCLIDRFGFSEDNITVLIDTDERYTQPTGANIRGAMTDLVSNAEDGDILFFHYSGHGTRLPAEAGEDDSTGYDECIVPSDMNLINGRPLIFFKITDLDLICPRELSIVDEFSDKGFFYHRCTSLSICWDIRSPCERSTNSRIFQLLKS